MKKDENKRVIQTKVYVSEHDLKVVGGRTKMSNIVREARDKAVKEMCGCEICQSGNKC